MMKKYSGIIRLQYFETDSYNSRIYAYENDVLYSYAIPAFSDKGMRFYATFNYDATKNLSIWLRWASTIYTNKNIIGTGLDQINSSRKQELKIQVRFIF